ncbi:translation initiation factor IF-2/translation initiation factor 4G, partial [Paenimyroides aquimaris]
AEEKARLEAEAQAKKEAEEKSRLEAEAKKQQALKELEEKKNNENIDSDFINKLEQDFKNSINNPKIKRVLIEGKEVTKKEALKLSVFDVETSIITFDKVNGDGTLEIKLTKK